MDDIWFQKLLLPTLDGIPPPVLASILNCWYEERIVTRKEQLQPAFMLEHEIELLNFLKNYATHMVIAGTMASMVAKEIFYRGKVRAFIPVYENLDKHFIPTLEKMMANAKTDSMEKSQMPGLKELLEFCDKIISNQSKNTLDRLYSQQKRDGKRMKRKFVEFNYKSIRVQWIEVPIDPCSFFIKHVPLCTLFLFYLLGSIFDIPTSRIAILDWENEEIEEGKVYVPMYVTEILHLIYRLPGYDEHILSPESDYYKIHYMLPHEYLRIPRPRYYERRCAQFKEEYERINRYGTYLNTKIKCVKNEIKHPSYRIPSLTTLCLSILVSLSDLSWVKFKQHFPYTEYMDFMKAKRKMLVEIQGEESL